MSFGLSFSDIEKGISIALELQKAFFKVNRAELRFKQFGDEIRSLEKGLRKLGDVFETAIREREERLFFPDNKALDSIVDRERRELVGDFEKTLVRCHALLSENAKFLTKSAGVWDNAKWHFKTQNSVDLLQIKLQSHAAKIALILQPLKCQLLHEISDNVWDIKRNVQALRGEVRDLATLRTEATRIQEQDVFRDHLALPPVPSELDSLFLEAVEVRKPAAYAGIAAFPLQEGLNALISHFRESTVKCPDIELAGCGNPTVEQLLNLIKARWVLGKLKNSTCLQETGASSLWARSLALCERKILEQFQRPAIGYDVCVRESSNLSQLGRENFAIWIAEEPLQAPRTITDEDSGEEKILEIPLHETDGISKKTLMLFRQAMNEFRIVRTAVPEAERFVAQPDEKIINTHAFRISPHFLLPIASPSLSLHISGNHVHRGDFYDLKCLEDLLHVQHALTGYKVVHQSTNVDWTTCHRGFFKTQRHSGNGIIQVWKAVAMSRMASADSDCGVRAPATSSRGSVMASTTAEEIARRFSTGIASVRSGSSGSGQVIVGSKPRDPVLVLFTKWQGSLAFLHLQLEQSIKLKREPCNCTEPKHACCEVVIAVPGRKKFLLRKHTAEKDKNGRDILPTWNLSVLGLPRHPDFHALEKMDDVVWLNLQFSSPDGREAFEKAFQTAVSFRNLEQGEFQQLSFTLEWRSHKQGSRDDYSPLALSLETTSVRA